LLEHLGYHNQLVVDGLAFLALLEVVRGEVEQILPLDLVDVCAGGIGAVAGEDRAIGAVGAQGDGSGGCRYLRVELA
jgi:hypothetical protein